MSAVDIEGNWNFRVFDQRLIVIKTKSTAVRKAAVQDVLTNLMFAIEVPPTMTIDELAVGHQYMANLRVYTQKDAADVDKEFVAFFEALDVNQSIEDFIRAYWVYPGKIRFELIDVTEP
jgi:hypothetical protein